MRDSPCPKDLSTSRGYKRAGDEPGDMQSFCNLHNAPCSKEPYFSPKVRAKLSIGLHTTLRKTGHEKHKDINWLVLVFFWGGKLEMILVCLFWQDELWAFIPTSPLYLTFTWPSAVLCVGGR